MNNNFVKINEVGLSIPKFTRKISDLHIVEGEKIPESYILEGSKEELKENTLTLNCPYDRWCSQLHNGLFCKSICSKLTQYCKPHNRLDVIIGYDRKFIGLSLAKICVNKNKEIYLEDPTLKYLKKFGKCIIKILKKIEINNGELLFSRNIKFIKVWNNILSKGIDKKFLKICKGKFVIKFSIIWNIPKNTPVLITYKGKEYNNKVIYNRPTSKFESYNDNSFHVGYNLKKSNSSTCFQYSLSGKVGKNLLTKIGKNLLTKIGKNLLTKIQKHIIGIINMQYDGFTNGLLIIGAHGFTQKIYGISLESNYNAKEKIIEKLNGIATYIDSKKEFLELKNGNNITGSYYFIETITLKKYQPPKVNGDEKVEQIEGEFIFSKVIYKIHINFNKQNSKPICENFKYIKNTRKNHMELRFSRSIIYPINIDVMGNKVDIKYIKRGNINIDDIDIIEYTQNKYLPILNKYIPSDISQIIVEYCGNIKEVIDFESVLNSKEITNEDLALLLRCHIKSGCSLLCMLLHNSCFSILHDIISFYTFNIIDLFIDPKSHNNHNMMRYIQDRCNKDAKLLLDHILHR